MKHSHNLIQKIEYLSNKVKADLRKKGIVVPITNPDKSITLGLYRIVKKSNGFFSIFDYGNEIVVDNINLPQTAVLVANQLALGKFLNKDLIEKDRFYGYAAFEEDLTKRTINKHTIDQNRMDFVINKYLIARDKKKRYKQSIDKDFEKLRRVR